jgi:RimJ/RimL family protein N-acetyltransferase
MALHVTTQPQDKLRAWIAPRIGTDLEQMAHDMEVLAVVDEARPVSPLACIGYNAHFGHYLSMHVASDGNRRWLTRDVLRLIFGYAFDYKGVTRINAVVAEANLPAQVMCLKLGFRIEATLRCGADDGTDGILFGMLRTECPWWQPTGDQVDG